MAKKSKSKKTSSSGTPNAAPKDGTVCAKIWHLCEKHHGNRPNVLKECAQRKINPATATTQYGRWRVFTGYVRPKSAKVVNKAMKKAAKKPIKKAPRKVTPKAAPEAAAPAAEASAS